MSNWRDHQYTAKDIGFYLASSDRELIDKVSSIMKRNGHMTFCDSMGREHYLVDGRSGVPVLKMNIDSVTRRIIDSNKDEHEKIKPYFAAAIEKTLEMSGLPKQLKGYRYIKFILFRLIEDETLVSPLSKTIYPGLCELFHCTTLQIERDIRYAIKRTMKAEKLPSPKVYVCSLLEHANNLICEMKARDNIVVKGAGDITGGKKER
ncbi:MAG: sporulation initiation factor Spo0A C-terminal domain-containing protein [Saccharofermentanales bacterium]